VTTERRRFIVKAGGAMAAVAAAAIVDAPNVIAQPKVQWRMSTAWTPALDVLQGAAQRLAMVVEETSGGRFRIEVFPGGQIMQPFDRPRGGWRAHAQRAAPSRSRLQCRRNTEDQLSP
jgi:TRAP-type mannitol/chloroaromatic compound transport system substrate-binding protein